jgi:hypothetical protein
VVPAAPGLQLINPTAATAATAKRSGCCKFGSSGACTQGLLLLLLLRRRLMLLLLLLLLLLRRLLLQMLRLSHQE